MKNILLVHGYNGVPQIFEYFKNEFEALGYNVIIPQFPTRENITVEGYEKVFNEIDFNNLNNELIVIAHSIGNAMFVKYLHKYHINVNKYISLAGFGKNYVLPDREDITNVTKLITLSDDEANSAKTLIKNRISIYSDNDHIVPFNRLEEYWKLIDSKPILIPNIGHMGKKSGLKELPEVIKLV